MQENSEILVFWNAIFTSNIKQSWAVLDLKHFQNFKYCARIGFQNECL